MINLDKVPKERLIGTVIGKNTKNLFLCVGGIHGNEKDGVIALEKVIADLSQHKEDVNGSIVALKGNLRAIHEVKRYIDYDLNRIWRPEFLEKINNPNHTPEYHEEIELKGLHKSIHAVIDAFDAEKIFFLDLHNTSSPRGTFAVSFCPDIQNELKNNLKVPIIMGMEKALKGTLVEYIENLGYHGIAFEGGDLNADTCAQILESGTWIILKTMGMIAKENIPKYSAHRAFLNGLVSNFPLLNELRYVHKIDGSEDFKMNPGYSNFQMVEKGDLLAKDKNGEIRAPHSGILLMPLYQKQGQEGFYIIEDKNKVPA